MKAIILILMLLASTFAQEERLQVGPKDLAQFVQGFLKGSMGEDFGDIETCMTNADSIIHSIEAIVKAIAGKDLKDIIIHVFALIHDIPEGIKNCKQLPSKIKDTFKAWASKIANPFTLVKIIANAIFKYSKEIRDNGNNFLSSWKAQQFKASGESLGNIPYIIFNKCQCEEDIPENAVSEILVSE